MTSTPQITMLRVGDKIPGHPGQGTFSLADLNSIAAAYDPALDPAPLIIGEPKMDDPAYGWVDGFSVRDGKLVASASQVEPSFAEQVKQGLYTGVRASFYPPANPNNPKPGRWYPRHISFEGMKHTLKAVLQAIRPVPRRLASFAEGSELGIVSFAAGPAAAVIEFSAPAGYATDPRQLALYRQAATICASRPHVSFIDAAKEACCRPLASFGEDVAATAEFGAPKGWSVQADQMDLWRRARDVHGMEPGLSWMEAVKLAQ